jgi:hypothetical protein
VSDMADSTPDQRASAKQVRAHATAVRQAAGDVGATDVRLLDDGTVVIHSEVDDYSQVLALVRRARRIVGQYVDVITDDVPAAVGARPL